jgi:mono/diheme cytochrome c family protein
MLSKTRNVSLLTLLSFFTFFLCLNAGSAQDLAKGEQIFKTNCTACHKLGAVLIGPDLTGVKSRWKDEKKLHAFIKNPNAFATTDPYVKGLVAKANGVVMTPMPLSDEEINDVVAYANAGGTPTPQTAESAPGGASPGAGASSPGSSASSGNGLFGMSYGVTVLVLLGLFVLLLMIAYTLNRIGKQLRRMGVTQEPTSDEVLPRKEGWLRRNWKFYRKYGNPTLAILTIVSILVFLWFVDLYDRTQDLGTQINYAPEQPIKFNHKIHAGQYKIQCQYCHTGVDRGKQANIPPLSTCMNCHNYIEEGPQYGKTEIAKLRKAYEQKTPVKWVRIHNLPDHVYFNHSQHVVAGKVQCASCHGAVQEMERVRQVSTLEMGWCINCHRETEVDKSNPYYTATYDFIQKHDKYTIGQLGGLECSKCHY